MEEIIREIRQAKDTGLYVLALIGALSIIDMCAALASDDGTTTRSKFKDWLRQNVPEQASDADLIYGLRCSLLHQGRAHPHGSVFPMAFTAGQGGLHNLSTEVNGQRVGWCHIDLFVDEVLAGVDRWFGQYGSTNRVQRNLEKFARVRPEGLSPHVVGRPVIA
jgi:hypothetical protein